MNSNWKPLPAAILVAVLALAGCGRDDSDDTTTTPEEECRPGGGVVYEDVECRTADDLRGEGREAESEKRDQKAADAARQADAEKFHGLLSVASPDIAQPVNLRNADYATQVAAAEDGVYNEGMVRIMIRNTMGSSAEFGWWLDERAATTTARVGAWYASNAGVAIADLNVAGSSGLASYAGQAIGVAAYHHRLGGDLNVGGAFTADAALRADFDTNMLGGSITNFDVGGHNPDWSVALGSSAIDAVTGAVANAGTTTWTIGGTDGDARNDAAGGGWTARFHDIPAGAHQPTGVAGGFRAQFESDGYMVGAFGAEK